MKKYLILLVVVLSSLGGLSQEHVRFGIGAGANMTSSSRRGIDQGYKPEKMQPGGEIFGAANVRLGERGWMAEGRLGLSLNQWKRMDLWAPRPPGPDADIEYRSLNLRLPVMIGYKCDLSRAVGVYGLIGPSVNYSPLRELRRYRPEEYGDPYWQSDEQTKRWWLGGDVRIGVELFGHHRIEMAYTITLTYTATSYDTKRQHIAGIGYAYMF